MTQNVNNGFYPAQRGLNRTDRSPTNWDGTNRREQEERRSYTLRTLQNALLSPRRFRGRRSADRRFPVLDRFDSGMAFLAIGLMILSIMDSVFTLTLISHGGTEENPFMDWFLQRSISAFVAVKMLFTAIPALLLVATGNVMLFGWFRARTILSIALGLYCALIVYELGLLSQIYY